MRDERGMVSVETGFATLFLALVVGVSVVVAGAVFTLGQCQVAANEIARQAARGDAAAVARASADVPQGARVSTRREGGALVVEVAWAASVGPVTWPVTARASVLEER